MSKRNTKQDILDASLDLFSVRGYEATSMADIAEAVGIRKASLYTHYSSKEEIFTSLIDFLTRQYESSSIFAKMDFHDGSLLKKPDDVAKEVKRHVMYIVHDPNMAKIRRLMVIEQFGNPAIKKLQQKYSYDDVMEYGEKMMRYLIDEGIFKDGDVKVLVGEFCLPISMWISLCDRMPSKQEEAMDMIERHVMHFYSTNMKGR